MILFFVLFFMCSFKETLCTLNLTSNGKKLFRTDIVNSPTPLIFQKRICRSSEQSVAAILILNSYYDVTCDVTSQTFLFRQHRRINYLERDDANLAIFLDMVNNLDPNINFARWKCTLYSITGCLHLVTLRKYDHRHVLQTNRYPSIRLSQFLLSEPYEQYHKICGMAGVNHS